jgi:hypothetical protein
MITKADKDKIKKAFKDGNLKVKSIDPTTKTLEVKMVKDVMRHDVNHKPLVKITTKGGRSVLCTPDHSLFDENMVPIQAGSIKPGSSISTWESGNTFYSTDEVISIEFLNPEPYAYDLCVPGPENFILESGIVAHNSYSIGGISLDISKASAYEGLKGNAESQLDKLAEYKTRTEKYTRGLQQSRYGVGVRSSFGPASGRSVITPRKYLGF